MIQSSRERFRPMTIFEFQARFPNEEACAQFLFEQRWPHGWKCPGCGNKKGYRLTRRKLYECAACGHQASVTAGTVLHGTRTPLGLWFLAIFLMVIDKRGISSVGLAKYLGVRQKKAWTMLHKLRGAMDEREGRYRLDGVVELSEYFFGAPKEGGGRGCDPGKAKVLAGLSLDKHGNPKFIRMSVLHQFDQAHLAPAIKAMVATGSTIRTDGLRVFLSLPAMGYTQKRAVTKDSPQSAKSAKLRMIVSNAMALIAGTHHGVSSKHLGMYLAEYDYRFNRRQRMDLIVDRMVAAVASSRIRTYADIIGKVAKSSANTDAA